MQEALGTSGHHYANSLAAADLNITTVAVFVRTALADHSRQGLREQWSGLSQLRFLRSLEQRPLEEVAEELRQLGAIMVNRAVLGVAINAEAEQRTEVVGRLAELASSLPSLSSGGAASDVPRLSPAPRTFVGIPSSVHFVVKSFAAPHPWSADYVHLDVRDRPFSVHTCVSH